MIRRILTAAATAGLAAGLTLAMTQTLAAATSHLADPPVVPQHVEEADGCDHGATGKPCRPDPQPDHGADCLVHGNHGGVNEDHCEEESSTSTTITAPPPTPTTTTSTTAPPSPSTSTTTSTAPPAPTVSLPERTSPTTAPTPPAPETPTECVDAAGYPFTTSYPACPEPLPVHGDPISRDALPHTGGSSALAGVALALVMVGLALRLAAKRR